MKTRMSAPAREGSVWQRSLLEARGGSVSTEGRSPVGPRPFSLRRARPLGWIVSGAFSAEHVSCVCREFVAAAKFITFTQPRRLTFRFTAFSEVRRR
jgi:hypothetical protein